MSQESDTVFGRQAQEPDPAVDPAVPSISIKPGWQTSQGQMTALFVFLLVTLAGLFGWDMTEDKAQATVEAVTKGLVALGALLAAWRQLQAYTNSRGKTYSNAIWANASIQNPLVRNDALVEGAEEALAQEYKALAGVKIRELLDAVRAGDEAQVIDLMRGAKR